MFLMLPGRMHLCARLIFPSHADVLNVFSKHDARAVFRIGLAVYFVIVKLMVTVSSFIQRNVAHTFNAGCATHESESGGADKPASRYIASTQAITYAARLPSRVYASIVFATTNETKSELSN